MTTLSRLVRLVPAFVIMLVPVLAPATSQPALEVTLIAPAVIYPDAKPEIVSENRKGWLCRLSLLSEALEGKTLADVQLLLNDRPVPLKQADVNTLGAPESAKKLELQTVYGSLSGKQLDLAIPWMPLGWDWVDYHGTLRVRLGIDGRLSDTKEVVISAVRPRFWPVTMSTIAAAIILGLPIGLLWLGGKRDHIAGKQYSVLSSLFLDKATDTYSLSKFQFYAWTAAAVFGYLALTVTKSFVQGQFVFSEIPSGLPGLIFISGATTVVAQSVASIKGPKGAGDIQPSLSDFVSTGGLVVAERFQFFVWTLLGVSTFLFLIVFHHPATLTDLPRIPEGFLALMGISSFGYLGGKIARKPGPIIDDIKATRGSLSLEIIGRKLSRDATVQIDDVIVAIGEAEFSPSDPEDGTGGKPEFYKRLTVRIASPVPQRLIAGRHKVKVINPDAQAAEWFYSLLPMPVITKAEAEFVGTQFNLYITGTQISKDATFLINDVAVQPRHGVEVKWGVQDLDDLRDDRVPPLYRDCTLTINTPDPAWVISATNPPPGIVAKVGKLVIVNDAEHKSAPVEFYLK